MAMGLQQNRGSSLGVAENGGYDSKYDDDGRLKRTGTWITATAHLVTAVIGSGVLSLGWSVAQLGWLAGPVALLAFALITLYSCFLLADSYRYPDSVHGKRNYTYMEMVKKNLGGYQYIFCALVLYGNLIGITIGYNITASISMVAVKRSNCFHKYGHGVGCHSSNNIFMIIFGIIEIILSQIPDFHELSGLSIIAALMSFGYSLIGIGLSIAKIAGGNHGKTSLTGVIIGVDVTRTEKLWRVFQAIGNVAFSYCFGIILVDIQDTLKSSPPENQEMKKASIAGTTITTLFYMGCAVLGYAAFGNKASGNFLTGFGFYEPFWLVDIGNIFVVIHLVGAYQVFAQPVFRLVDHWCKNRWPGNNFMAKEYIIRIPLVGKFRVNLFRVIWRTLYVIFTTVVAMLLPFFNDILGIIGAGLFWPLTVYFPLEMKIAQAKIPKFSSTWIAMQILSALCLLVTLIAAAGSIQGIITGLKSFEPFHSIS